MMAAAGRRVAGAVALILSLPVPSCRAPAADAGPAEARTVEPEPVAAWPESFAFLQSVLELPDGRVLVADPLGGVLARLDLRAGTTEPVGREGSGPGEWRQPDAVHALPGDSTLLVDLGNARLAVLDGAGAFVHAWPMALTPAVEPGGNGPVGGAPEIVQPRATDGAGRIYYQTRPRPPAGPSAAGPAAAPDSVEVRRWEPGSGKPVRLAGLRPAAARTTSSGSGAQVQVMSRPVPLSPQDDWAVGADGRVALVRAEPYRVEWLNADGSTTVGPAVTYEPVGVRDAEKQRWLDNMAGTGLSMMMSVENGASSMQFRRGGGGMAGPAGSVQDYDWPATLPPFRAGGTRVDALGRVWVERYDRAGAPARFDVFDERGVRTLQVRLPGEHRIVGFGADAVYTARIDELGLYWLEVFALPR